MSTDDIKLEIKVPTASHTKAKPKQQATKAAKTEDEYRNFNTIPRNYAE